LQVQHRDSFLGGIPVPESANRIEVLETIAQVLLRCTVLGFGLLLLWFGAYLLIGDLIYQLHGNMFGLSQHELDVIHYCGMGLVKLFVFVFFLFPWIAIKLVLSKT
jgi:hypothetical protein